ncbi:MAG: hypothetical protein M1824_004201 [Vezdaea acicularis]|nr:MAG: hypothetical protein M1824_004201 [Vezdaea acicularis]
MPARAIIPFLVAMMLVTGVCNTLLTKYQDMQCVRNCESPSPKKRQHFEQPVIQTAQMFIGEMGCWLVVGLSTLYERLRSRQHLTSISDSGYEPVLTSADGDADNPIAKALAAEEDADGRAQLHGWRIVLLGLPACCDIAGTTLMNVGLLFVAASIYQMTRGALVLFVGLFSVVFLKRRLHLYQWSALVLVVVGVGIVGLAGALFKDDKATPSLLAEARTPETVRAIIGIFLIAGAQIFTATQFVLEEWILNHYALQPLKVVGWEGIFGFVVTVLGMTILHFTVGVTEAGKYGYFDAVEGWREITHYRSIAVSSVLIMISIGGFNFFGLSVTRTVSATSRSTIDTCRTLFIWIVSLGLGWETFKWLQVVGFALLVYGTFLFNNIVTPPLRACLPRRELPAVQPRSP